MPIRRWTEELSTRETNDITKGLALAHCARITCQSERKRIHDYISRDNILALCDLDPAYSQLTVADASNIRQISAFYSKRRDIDLGIDKRAVAVGKFIEAERLCAQTNDIIRLRAEGRFSFDPHVESVLHSAQRKIAHILGDLPTFEALRMRLGPGATTQVKKKNASAKRKLAMPFSCSEDAVGLLPELLAEFPQWVFDENDGQTDVKTVPVEIHTGRLDFVRKSYKTDRAIVVEPMLNSMVQLGIGDYIARRLRMTGIDIRDQSRNKLLAQKGSITGDLATLDLSSASDTIAKGLVLDLLPEDWSTFLSHFRSSLVDCDGYVIRQQKFSSMGNGFTFPLETLIFYALSWACTDEHLRENVSTYGDDIIVPVSAYDLLCKVLHCCGFVPNKAKSFASGPFRESCGGDYLYGIDIRPCYIKDRLSGQSLFVLHNFYVRRGDEEMAAIVLSFIPPHIHLWGPDKYGDGHLIGERSLRPHGREKGWAGYTFETYTMKARKDFTVDAGDRVYPFYSTYVSELRPDAIDESWSPLPYSYSYAPEIAISETRHTYDKRGRLGVPLPGATVYNRVKIYTFASA